MSIKHPNHLSWLLSSNWSSLGFSNSSSCLLRLRKVILATCFAILIFRSLQRNSSQQQIDVGPASLHHYTVLRCLWINFPPSTRPQDTWTPPLGAACPPWQGIQPFLNEIHGLTLRGDDGAFEPLHSAANSPSARWRSLFNNDKRTTSSAKSRILKLPSTLHHMDVPWSFFREIVNRTDDKLQLWWSPTLYTSPKYDKVSLSTHLFIFEAAVFPVFSCVMFSPYTINILWIKKKL